LGKKKLSLGRAGVFCHNTDSPLAGVGSGSEVATDDHGNSITERGRNMRVTNEINSSFVGEVVEHCEHSTEAT
jgi:hypothetical protein